MTILRRSFLALFLILTITLTACEDPGPKSTVWFIPNIGSQDLLSMFSTAGFWSNALGAIDVFGFHTRHLVCFQENELGCPKDLGHNVYLNFKSADAFKVVKTTWGKKIALFVKPVGESEDEPCGDSFFYLQMAFDNLKDAGGSVDFITLDQPLHAYTSCGQSSTAPKLTVDFLKRTKLVFSGGFGDTNSLQIGITETLNGTFMTQDILNWVDALQAADAQLSSFNLNVNRTSLKEKGWSDENIASALTEIKTHFQAKQVPLGIIIMGESANTQEYATSAQAWVETVKKTIGNPEHIIFQSWVVGTDEFGHPSRNVPKNLDERDPTSHTAILKKGMAFFNAP
jgi:hypothetical protein